MKVVVWDAEVVEYGDDDCGLRAVGVVAGSDDSYRELVFTVEVLFLFFLFFIFFN